MLEKLKIRFNSKQKELFEILKSPPFFHGNFNLQGYFVIHDKSEAQDLYETQDPDYTIYSSYPDLLGERTPLTYLFEGMTMEAELKAEYLWRTYKDQLWNLILQLQQENQDLFPEPFIDFVYNDFLTFAAYGVFSKIKDDFIEKQIEVYKNGGFPCGWKGEFPDGVMVVYSPE